MNIFIIAYLIAFSIFLFLLVRHYLSRLSFHRIKSYVDNKQIELEKAVDLSTAELEDAAQTLQADVQHFRLLKQNMQSLTQHFEHKKSELNGYMEKLDRAYVVLSKQNKEMKKAVAVQGKDLLKMEEMHRQTQTLGGMVTNTLKNFDRIADEKTVAINKMLSQQLQLVKSEMAQADSKKKTMLAGVDAKVQEKTVAISKMLSQQLQAVESEMVKAESKNKTMLAGVDAKVQEKTVAINKMLLQQLQSVKSEMAQAENKNKTMLAGVDAKVQEKTVAINKMLSQQLQSVKSEMAQVDSKNKTMLAGVDAKVQEKTAAINKMLSQQLQSVETEVAKVEGEKKTMLAEVEAMFNSKQNEIEKHEKTMLDQSNKRYNQLQGKIEEDLEKASKALYEKIEKTFVDLEQDAKKQIHVFNAELSATQNTQGDLQQRCDELSYEMQEYRQNFQKNLDESVEVVAEDFKGKLDMLQETALAGLDETYRQLQQQAQAAKLEIENREKTIEAELKEIRTENLSFKKKFVDKNANSIKNLEERLKSFALTFGDIEEKTEISQKKLEEINSFFSEARDLVTSRVNAYNQVFDNKRSEIEKLFEEKAKTVEAEFARIIKTLSEDKLRREEVKTQQDENSKRIAELQKKMDKEISAFVKTESKKLKNALQSQLQNVFTKLEDSGESRLEEVIAQLEKFAKEQSDKLEAVMQKNENSTKRSEKQAEVFEERLASLQKQWLVKYTALEKSNEVAQEKLLRELQKTSSALLKQEQEKMRSKIEAFLKKYNLEMVSRREKIFEEHRRQLEKALRPELKDIKTRLERMRDQVASEVEKSKSTIGEALRSSTMQKKLVDDVLANVQKIEDEIKAIVKQQRKAATASEGELFKIRENIRKKINMKNLVEKIMVQLSSKMEEDVVEAFSRVNKRLFVDIADAEKKVASLELKNEQRLEKLSRDVEKKIKQKKREISILEKDVLNMKTSLKDTNDGVKDLSKINRKALQKMVDEFQMKVKNAEQKLTREVSAKTQLLENDILEVGTKIDTFLKETSIFQKTEKLAKDLKLELAATDERLKKSREQNREFQRTAAKFEKLLISKKSIEDYHDRFDGHEKRMKMLDKAILDFTADQEALTKQLKVWQNNRNEISDFLDKAENYSIEIKSARLELEALNAKKVEAEEALAAIQQWQVKMRSVGENSSRIAKRLERSLEVEQNLKKRLDEIEAKSLYLEENYKNLGEFEAKYDQLDFLVEDMDGRMKALEEMRRKIILERNDMQELRKKFDEQIKVVLQLVYKKSDGSKTGFADKDITSTIQLLKAIGWDRKEIASQLSIPIAEVDMLLSDRLENN